MVMNEYLLSIDVLLSVSVFGVFLYGVDLVLAICVCEILCTFIA